MWLYDHMMALGTEYYVRYGKTHLTITKCKDFLATPPKHIQGDEWSQPPQAMPDEYKHKDSIIAYWQYYINDKSHIAGKTENKYREIPIY